MTKVLQLVTCAITCLLPAFADIVPVEGYTTATFANPSGGSTVSGENWFYDGNDGMITFTGIPFSGSTPSSVNLGMITLTNLSNHGNGLFTADLDLALTFTMPTALVTFADDLQLTAKPGNGDGHADSLEFDFGEFPSPKTFTIGSETYTVSYDGFFDSGSNNDTPLTSLFVANKPGGTASAFLWASITATDPPPAPVPEPASILLLGTFGVGIAGLGRRRFPDALKQICSCRAQGRVPAPYLQHRAHRYKSLRREQSTSEA